MDKVLGLRMEFVMALPKLWAHNLRPKGIPSQENPNFGNQTIISEERFSLPNTIIFNEVDPFHA
jgi:hypothetical protein